MAFTPYSQLSAVDQAVKKLRLLQSQIPAKQTSAIRVLNNAIMHISGKDIHPDNRGEVARLWKRLPATKK